MTWDEADANCREKGKHLVSIHRRNENDKIWSEFF